MEPASLEPAAPGELRRMAMAAMPGPWSAGHDEMGNFAYIYGPDGDGFIKVDWNPGRDNDVDADAAYIAAVNPTAVLRLLDVVDAARRLIAVELGLVATTVSVDSQTFDAFGEFVDAKNDLYAAVAAATPPQAATPPVPS